MSFERTLENCNNNMNKKAIKIWFSQEFSFSFIFSFMAGHKFFQTFDFDLFKTFNGGGFHYKSGF
jgi:hypothetical protein